MDELDFGLFFCVYLNSQPPVHFKCRSVHEFVGAVGLPAPCLNLSVVSYV